ncbi:MAG: cytochrome c [Myxococcales bacterium]|nr:cytochrome c [Myxococcales bacterium]
MDAIRVAAVCAALGVVSCGSRAPAPKTPVSDATRTTRHAKPSSRPSRLPSALRRTRIPPGEPSERQLAQLAMHAPTRRAGAAIYLRYCRPCHGDGGRGLIGPNLTDRHQLHGTTRVDLLRTVRGGVPGKGMPPWSTILPHQDLVRIAAYAVSLRGTFAAGGKAPQGTPLPRAN